MRYKIQCPSTMPAAAVPKIGSPAKARRPRIVWEGYRPVVTTRYGDPRRRRATVDPGPDRSAEEPNDERHLATDALPPGDAACRRPGRAGRGRGRVHRRQPEAVHRRDH